PAPMRGKHWIIRSRSGHFIGRLSFRRCLTEAASVHLWGIRRFSVANGSALHSGTLIHSSCLHCIPRLHETRTFALSFFVGLTSFLEQRAVLVCLPRIRLRRERPGMRASNISCLTTQQLCVHWLHFDGLAPRLCKLL